MRKVKIVLSEPEKEEEEVHIHQIDDISDCSVDELIIGDCLDFIANREAGLQKLIGKLRHGGTIDIRGLDILDIARNIFLCTIPHNEINPILYDKGRCSCDSIIGVIDVLAACEMKIVIKQISNYSYYVRAVRPNV